MEKIRKKRLKKNSLLVTNLEVQCGAHLVPQPPAPHSLVPLHSPLILISRFRLLLLFFLFISTRPFGWVSALNDRPPKHVLFDLLFRFRVTERVAHILEDFLPHIFRSGRPIDRDHLFDKRTKTIRDEEKDQESEKKNERKTKMRG
jgi:hypothetical protein